MPTVFLKFFRKPISWVILFVIVVSTLNIILNSYLIGWDNLQVELGYGINLRRNFFAAWQEYQGLGLAAGHAHGVEFIRLVLFYPLYIILPQALFRYAFHLTMYFIGGFGMYLFLGRVLLGGTRKHFTKRFVVYLGTLFYLLNLGTIQNFYAPLEPFSAFYAFFPLSIYFIFTYLKLGGVKNLIYLNLAFILLTFAYQIQTFFIVYFICICIPLLFKLLYSFYYKNYTQVKRVFLVLFSKFVVNVFWLFNVIYFYIQSVDVRFSSIINRFASEDSFLQNAEYGTVTDVFLLRGFWFGNKDYLSHQNQFGFMMERFANWNSSVIFLGFIFALVAFLGLTCLLLKLKSFKNTVIFYLLLLSLFFFFNINGPTAYLYRLMQDYAPTLAEVFRFTFTKWVVVYVFVYTCLFSYGILSIIKVINLIPKLKNNTYYTKSIFSIFAILLVVYVLPLFKGGLFYDNVQVKVPNEYQQVFEYFKNEPKSTRIANLPQPTFWGWYYTDWGYRGSGFLWYGIEQPITDRAFDVWNYKNEQFYNEFQYAIYSENPNLLAYVLQKYQINYLLLDKNVIAPGSPRATFTPQTQSLLAKTPNVSLSKSFGQIDIYTFNGLSDNVQNFVYTPNNFSLTNPRYNYTNIDSAFFNQKVNYINYNSQKDIANNLYFPFADDKYLAQNYDYTEDTLLFSSVNDAVFKSTQNVGVSSTTMPANITTDNNELVVNYIYPKVQNLKTGQFVYNPIYKSSYQISVNESYNLLFNGETLSKPTHLLKPTNNNLVVYQSIPDLTYNLSDKIYSIEPFNCGVSGEGVFGKFVKGDTLILSSKKTSVCTDFTIDFTNGGPAVYKISFDYKSNDNVAPNYCLVKEGFNGCLNKKYKNSPLVSEVFTSYTDFVYVNDPSSVYLSFGLENLENIEKQVEIKNIKVEGYKVLQTINFDIPVQAYSNLNTSFNVLANTPYLIDLKEYRGLSGKYFPGSSFYNPTEKNCDNFNANSFSRNLLKDASSGNSFFKYSATDAISCDSIKTQTLDALGNYLLTFNYKNITGKSLDVCVAGVNLDKCMLIERLNPANTSESFVLPSYSSVEEYRINIANQSIGRVQSENNLYSVETRYIPYNFIKGISLSSNTTNFGFNNNLIIQSVKHKYPHRYDLVVSSLAKDDYGLIVLNQSFDKGWGLYNKDTCKLGVVSPITCQPATASRALQAGEKVKAEHVLAKNWANAWFINNIEAVNSSKTSLDGGSINFIILFWPQWLQYFGYLFLIIWLFLLAFIYFKTHL